MELGGKAIPCHPNKEVSRCSKFMNYFRQNFNNDGSY